MVFEALPPFNPAIVNGKNVDRYFADFQYVDEGPDTIVKRFKFEYVLKQTKPHLTLKQLQDYQDATSIAMGLARGYSVQSEKYGLVSLAVVPIVSIIQSAETEQIYTLSKFITGERGTNGFDRRLDELLDMFTHDMTNEFNYFGIYMSAGNTRLNYNLLGERKTLCTITDICDSIRLLRLE